MAKSKERAVARRLRAEGESLGNIAKRLNVSKGSVSNWCQDLSLTNAQQKTLRDKVIAAGYQGRLLGAQKNRQKKLDIISLCEREGTQAIGKLNKRDLLMLGVALYWAEGTKTGARCIFINSDPAMIKLMYRFFTDVLGVHPTDIRLGVQINQIHRERINKVQSFWSELLGIPQEQFTNPYYVKIKPQKVYENHHQYYGVMRMRVVKGSQVMYKMLGMIEALK